MSILDSPPEYLWNDLKEVAGSVKQAFIWLFSILLTIGGLGTGFYKYLDILAEKAKVKARVPEALLERAEKELEDMRLDKRRIESQYAADELHWGDEKMTYEQRLDAQEADIHKLRQEVYQLQSIMLDLKRSLNDALDMVTSLKTQLKSHAKTIERNTGVLQTLADQGEVKMESINHG